MTEFVRQSMNKITLKEFEVLNTSNLDYAGVHGGTNKKWDITEEEKKIKINVVKMNKTDMEFDLIGFDPALANAFRRILLAEVPSMAIEKVHIYQNTSIMQDEVLSHRLGLIPLKADPRLFSWKEKTSDDEGTENDTLEFELKIKCSRRPGADPNSSEPDDAYLNHRALTEHVKWVPKGGQASIVSDPGPVEPDILINKLRPGHEMDIRMFAVKGIGRDHAKFSPVATAFYRLLPEITIDQEVTGEAAVRLQKCFSPGVVQLWPTEDGKKKAVVVNARNDSCSRNVYRYDDLKDCVTLSKVKDHFIFTVESVGATPPQDLFAQACDVLISKCDNFLKELDLAGKK